MSRCQHPPLTPDWSQVQLPDSWVDDVVNKSHRPWRWVKLAFNFLRAPYNRVELPASFPEGYHIPPYVLQNFHHLPNGNYSKYISRGYITGFDVVMLGEVHKAREHLASQFKRGDVLLDLGCGGGGNAAQLHQVSGGETWGVDPSPYLLKHAADSLPDIHFVQGLAEHLDFPDNYFDGIAICFLFHEMPPKYIRQALREIFRVLKPGGKLVVCEPSRVQYDLSPWRLLKQYGWRGVYFYAIAKFIHEPFLDAWHKFNCPGIYTEAGFMIEHVSEQMPVSYTFVTKPA